MSLCLCLAPNPNEKSCAVSNDPPTGTQPCNRAALILPAGPSLSFFVFLFSSLVSNVPTCDCYGFAAQKRDPLSLSPSLPPSGVWNLVTIQCFPNLVTLPSVRPEPSFLFLSTSLPFFKEPCNPNNSTKYKINYSMGERVNNLTTTLIKPTEQHNILRGNDG